MFIHRLLLNYAESKKSVFCRYSSVSKKSGSDQSPFYLSISRVFPDDVTISFSIEQVTGEFC